MAAPWGAEVATYISNFAVGLKDAKGKVVSSEDPAQQAGADL